MIFLKTKNHANMQTFRFEIRPTFAKSKNIPSIFIGKELRQTQKAVYIYGQGSHTTSKTGKCCVCGKTLTHPVSVLLGIGPECGGHFWNWDTVGGYSQENIEKLKIHLSNIKVDTWMPLSIIKSKEPIDETVEIPPDHKMLKPQEENMKKEKTCKQVQYQNGKAAIKIEFPFDMETVGNVKSLTWRKFHNTGTEKYWSCPLTLDNLEKLMAWGFRLDEKLTKFIKFASTSVDDLKEIEIPGLKGTPYPFQRKGVAFIESKNGRALIADEMGLGKTLQAIAYLQLHPELRPAVIIVPKLVKYKWEREIHKWMQNPGTIQILEGLQPNIPVIGDIVIANYDIISNNYIDGKELVYTGWIDYIIDTKPAILISDESHYFKNNKAKRTKAIKKIAKKVDNFIALSGTPIENRPIEIYNAVNLINPNLFPNFMAFAKRYCNAKHNGFGWDFSGASNISELHSKLTKSIMIRRLKKDVLTDLPDKIYDYIPLEITNRSQYEIAEDDFIEWVKNTQGIASATKKANALALTKIEGLKQLALEGKQQQIIEWIEDFLESDNKLVVFAVHRNIIDYIVSKFPKVAVKLDGSTTNRDTVINKFQTDDNCRLFVGNIKAAGVGIELTAANHVAIIEFPWTPGALDQAIDRLHRIGQKNTVNVNYLIAKDTIEEDNALLLDKKRNIISQTLDGIEADDQSLIGELINNLINKKQ